MKYPMIELNGWFGTVCREMTPEEYEERLQWYRDYICRHQDDCSRRDEEYVSYLRRWFSGNPCDGLDSYETRYSLHKLPMSFNIYFG